MVLKRFYDNLYKKENIIGIMNFLKLWISLSNEIINPPLQSSILTSEEVKQENFPSIGILNVKIAYALRLWKENSLCLASLDRFDKYE